MAYLQRARTLTSIWDGIKIILLFSEVFDGAVTYLANTNSLHVFFVEYVDWNGRTVISLQGLLTILNNPWRL